MDLASILAIGVAGLIVFSGYFLFNGVPMPKSNNQARRTPRRP